MKFEIVLSQLGIKFKLTNRDIFFVKAGNNYFNNYLSAHE